jgi:hypothetical protein
LFCSVEDSQKTLFQYGGKQVKDEDGTTENEREQKHRLVTNLQRSCDDAPRLLALNSAPGLKEELTLYLIESLADLVMNYPGRRWASVSSLHLGVPLGTSI